MTCYNKPSPIPLTVNNVSVYLDSAQIACAQAEIAERVSANTFTLEHTPITVLPVVIAINGLVQIPSVSYNIVGNTIVFNENVPYDQNNPEKYIVTATYCYYV